MYYNIYDFFRVFGKQQVPELKDFWLYAGMRGRGKTLTMTQFLIRMRKKWGNKILICTNYNFKLQDFAFTDWKMFQQDFNKPIIFAIDEIQNEFMSRSWKSFPLPVLQEFTQSRKKRKMLISTAQRFNLVDKALREYTDFIIEPNQIPLTTRLYTVCYYEGQDYLSNYTVRQSGGNFKPELRLREWYIAHDEVYDAYNTNDLIVSTRNKEYIPASQVQVNRPDSVSIPTTTKKPLFL